MNVNQLVKAAQTVLKPKLQTFIYYGKVELIPPKPSEIGEITKSIGRMLNSWKTGSWRDLTVKQTVLNGLVGLEVLCWFYVGEVIGKGHLRGYYLH